MKKDTKTYFGHIFLLFASCLLFSLLLIYGFYITAFIFGSILILEVYLLFKLMDKNSRMLKQYIWAIRYSDFQVGKSVMETELNTIPEELTDALNEAILHYKKNLQQKESQLQYFQALADHIDLSVLVFSKTGEIEWMNLAAHYQTGLQMPRTIDDLQAFHPELPARLRTLRPGDISILQVVRGEECYQLALSGMTFVVLNKTLTVVSMKNIRTVLENKETEAWQKLIRVLTHEIMNSMTPIVSLSQLIQEHFRSEKVLTIDDQADMQQAIDTIQRRSNGLLLFVENYRKVTGIPTPVLRLVSVSELLRNTFQLMKTGTGGLTLLPAPAHLQIIADKEQIEQVLINLIKNAREAMPEHSEPSIELSAGMNADGHTYIQVNDNGPGIPAEVLERIFIPFFTTKPAGSGIGLSLSRQIMHMHKGSLTATSGVGKGSRFILTFY